MRNVLVHPAAIRHFYSVSDRDFEPHYETEHDSTLMNSEMPPIAFGTTALILSATNIRLPSRSNAVGKFFLHISQGISERGMKINLGV